MSFTFEGISVEVELHTEGSLTIDGSAEEVAETIYELSEMSINDQNKWLRHHGNIEADGCSNYPRLYEALIKADDPLDDILRAIDLELDDDDWETKEEAIAKITQALNDWR